MHRRLLILAFLAAPLALASAGHADPPLVRGNNPPPPREIEIANDLDGPLAPKTAREWLMVLAPRIGWYDKATRKNLKVVASRYSGSLRAPVEESPTAPQIDLGVFRFGKRTILGITEHGICCCGSCIASIDFLESGNDKLVRVTDEIWPRFPWVTKSGDATDRIWFALSPGGKSVRIDAAQGNVTIYRLRWSRKLQRFEVTFRHNDWPKPYERETATNALAK